MRRDEACLFLSKIASDELIDKYISTILLKARDIVVCDKNEILDVLATPQNRADYKQYLIEWLKEFESSRFLSDTIRKQSRDLCIDLESTKTEFNGKCKQAYIKRRCEKCPNYIGNTVK